MSLFKNEKRLIKDLCDFRVTLDHITAQVVEISNTAILVYKTDCLEFDCENGIRVEKGCDFCIMSLSCKCSVTTTKMFLPPRLSGCHVNTTSKVHPVNLALLQQLFNDSSLKKRAWQLYSKTH